MKRAVKSALQAQATAAKRRARPEENGARPDPRGLAMRVDTIVAVLQQLDERQASRALLAAAMLLRCDRLITDLARGIVWTTRPELYEQPRR